jgi:hypothetical protein
LTASIRTGGGRGVDPQAGRVDADQPGDRREPQSPVARPPAGGGAAAVALLVEHAVGSAVDGAGHLLAPSGDDIVELALGDPEDPAVGAHPQVPLLVLEDTVDVLVEQAVVDGEHVGSAVLVAQQAAGGAEPQRPVGALGDVHHHQLGGRQLEAGVERRQLAVVHPSDPPSAGPDPQHALAVDVDDPDAVYGQSVGHVVALDHPIEDPAQASPRGDPDRALGVLGHPEGVVAGQAIGRGVGDPRTVLVSLDTVAGRAQPQPAVAVLEQRVDLNVGELLVTGEGYRLAVDEHVQARHAAGPDAALAVLEDRPHVVRAQPLAGSDHRERRVAQLDQTRRERPDPQATLEVLVERGNAVGAEPLVDAVALEHAVAVPHQAQIIGAHPQVVVTVDQHREHVGGAQPLLGTEVLDDAVAQPVQPAVLRADPEAPIVALRQIVDRTGDQPLVLIQAPGEAVGKPAQAVTEGAEPQPSTAILHDRVDRHVGQPDAGGQRLEPSVPIAVDPGVRCRPQGPRAVLIHRVDHRRRQPVLVGERAEAAVADAHQPPVCGGGPQIAVGGFGDVSEAVGEDGRDRALAVHREPHAVEARHAVLSPEPEIALPRLGDVLDRDLRQAVVGGPAVKGVLGDRLGRVEGLCRRSHRHGQEHRHGSAREGTVTHAAFWSVHPRPHRFASPRSYRTGGTRAETGGVEPGTPGISGAPDHIGQLALEGLNRGR